MTCKAANLGGHQAQAQAQAQAQTFRRLIGCPAFSTNRPLYSLLIEWVLIYHFQNLRPCCYVKMYLR